MRFFLFCCIFTSVLVLSSCKIPKGTLRKGERIKFANWNVQTFFDTDRNGTEYKDFVSSKNWCETAYEERLRRLCKSIAQLDADVLAMEEIENERILLDISNFLCSDQPYYKRYKYGAFSKNPGSALGCALLSRYPVTKVSAHAIDIRTGTHKQPSTRPLLKVTVQKNGKCLSIFINHWKSMSGGKEQSDIWRGEQEAALEQELENSAQEKILVCGDFNRDTLQFDIDKERAVWLHSPSGKLKLFSPWFNADGTLKYRGSYFFKDTWSRIDHLFTRGDTKITGFTVEDSGPWCHADTGIPKKYKIWTGSGYSDHLPLSCTVEF